MQFFRVQTLIFSNGVRYRTLDSLARLQGKRNMSRVASFGRNVPVSENPRSAVCSGLRCARLLSHAPTISHSLSRAQIRVRSLALALRSRFPACHSSPRLTDPRNCKTRVMLLRESSQSLLNCGPSHTLCNAFATADG